MNDPEVSLPGQPSRARPNAARARLGQRRQRRRRLPCARQWAPAARISGRTACRRPITYSTDDRTA